MDIKKVLKLGAVAGVFFLAGYVAGVISENNMPIEDGDIDDFLNETYGEDE